MAGVQTRSLNEEEQAYISRHARAFTPSTLSETIPEAMSGYADLTILTMLQLAAYTAPGTFEQGTALTVQEATPDFALHAGDARRGDPGKQWSSEKGKLTDTLVAADRGSSLSLRFRRRHRVWEDDRGGAPGVRDDAQVALPHGRARLRAGLAESPALAGLEGGLT